MGKRKYDDEFKRNAVTKVLNGQSVASVSREIGVNESLIHKWKRAAFDNGDGIKTGTELAERYRNRRKRLGLRFNLIAGIYNYELNAKRL